MKNKFIYELVLSVALIALLVFFLNPLVEMMPRTMHPFMIPLLVILFIIFAAMLWKERPIDEREQLHTFIASRFAYFSGIALLTVAIVIQHTKGFIDPWLIIITCVMLLAKIVGLLYGNMKH